MAVFSTFVREKLVKGVDFFKQNQRKTSTSKAARQAWLHSDFSGWPTEIVNPILI